MGGGGGVFTAFTIMISNSLLTIRVGDLQRIQRYLIQESSNAHSQIYLLQSEQKTKNSYKIFKLFKKSGGGEKYTIKFTSYSCKILLHLYVKHQELMQTFTISQKLGGWGRLIQNSHCIHDSC